MNLYFTSEMSEFLDLLGTPNMQRERSIPKGNKKN